MVILLLKMENHKARKRYISAILSEVVIGNGVLTITLVNEKGEGGKGVKANQKAITGEN